ncbi:DUF6389 family protein [Leucobacter chinensis]|uniref:DUF6389 family protein n=1 Tax=Leucobacter chinensis TaxID=2851010 RepID=UPI001C21C56D
MNSDTYRDAVWPFLAETTPQVTEVLDRLHRAATAEGVSIDGITVTVFVDQDGEGPFDVWAAFEGRDAFTLDRRFDDDRHLFGVEWGEQGWEPDVPPRPRAWSRDEFEEAVLEVVTEWLQPLTPKDGPDDFWRIEAAFC